MIAMSLSYDPADAQKLQIPSACEWQTIINNGRPVAETNNSGS